MLCMSPKKFSKCEKLFPIPQKVVIMTKKGNFCELCQKRDSILIGTVTWHIFFRIWKENSDFS